MTMYYFDSTRGNLQLGVKRSSVFTDGNIHFVVTDILTQLSIDEANNVIDQEVLVEPCLLTEGSGKRLGPPIKARVVLNREKTHIVFIN